MSRRVPLVRSRLAAGPLVIAAMLIAGEGAAQEAGDPPSPWLADPPPEAPPPEGTPVGASPPTSPAPGAAPEPAPALAPVAAPEAEPGSTRERATPAPAREPGAPAPASPSAMAPASDRPWPPADAADDHASLPRHAQWDLGFEVGLRVVAAADDSYDPYAPSDALAGGVLAVTWTPLDVGPITLGLVGEYGGSGSGDQVRGLESSLGVHRFALGAQGRLPLGQRVYLHAKVTPAAVHAVGSIDDPALDRSLDAAAWTWGLDATGGAAVLLARAGHPEAPAFRLWLVGEAGWSFTGRADMVHAPDEVDDDPRRFGEVAVSSLDTGGLVHRFAIAATF